MTVRAKFRVTEHTVNHWSPTAKKIALEPIYDTSIPEDKRFSDATPSGRIEMFVNNLEAADQLILGKEFYIDFTPVNPPVTGETAG